MRGHRARPRLWRSFGAVVWPRKPILIEPSRWPHRWPARVERFPTDGFLPGGTARLRAAPLASSRVYRARSHRRRAGIRFALPTDSNNHAGAKVTATATYCGHTLQAETDVDDLGRWTGRCVVDGPQFQGTVVLYSPFRAPTAALDALLTAARRSIDEGRGVTRRRSTRRRRLA
jgi:hypothetical protein